jgi:hypothetical protein
MISSSSTTSTEPFLATRLSVFPGNVAKPHVFGSESV